MCNKTGLINSAFFILCCFLLPWRTIAQVTDYDEDRRGALYLSLGTDVPTGYGSSTIHIDQSALGNSYDIVNAKATGTTSGSAAGFPMNIDFRLGYYVNYNQNFGIEINYDAAKYGVTDGQMVQIKGTVNGAAYNKVIAFSQLNGFQYSYNGIGILDFNILRRFGIYRSLDHNWAFDLTPKIGIGPVMSYAQANLFSVADKPSSKMSGWNYGAEIAAKATFRKHFYGEVSYKYNEVNETAVNIPNGTATQQFNSKMVVVTVGCIISTFKRNPLFSSGMKRKRVPRGPQPMYHGEKGIK